MSSMACNGVHEHLRDYLEEQLSAELGAAIEAHVQGCDECRKLLARCRELDCRGLADFLCDYVEGTLPAKQLHIFERHLEICSECEAYLDSYRKTVALGQSCHEVTPDVADIPDALVSAILEAREVDTAHTHDEPEAEEEEE